MTGLNLHLLNVHQLWFSIKRLNKLCLHIHTYTHTHRLFSHKSNSSVWADQLLPEPRIFCFICSKVKTNSLILHRLMKIWDTKSKRFSDRKQGLNYLQQPHFWFSVKEKVTLIENFTFIWGACVSVLDSTGGKPKEVSPFFMQH